MPEPTPDITRLPATELLRRYQDKSLSPVEVTQAVLDRIEHDNPVVNAFCIVDPKQALASARGSESRWAKGAPCGLVDGVPTTIKDVVLTKGWPTLRGSRTTDPHQSWEEDAPCTARLREQGAVLLGKTTTPEFGWKGITDSALTGITRNPWNTGRTPAGSSGGAAAAAALGLGALHIGTDGGGSIRMPAAFTGVFGHKPTMDLIPQQGHTAPGVDTAVDIAVVGPLARSAKDLDMALSVLAGPAGFDATGYRVDLPHSTRESLSDYRVGVLLDTPACKTATPLIDHLQGTVDQLAGLGVQASSASPQIDQVEFFENYLLLLRAATGASSNDEASTNALPGHEAWERGERTYRNLVDHGTHMTHREWFGLHQQRERYRQQWAKYFDEFDLLLCPAAASTAFPHDHEGERPDRTIEIDGGQEPVVDQLFWAGWSCSVYLPSTVAPVGLLEGLPVGIQIVAPHLHDRRSIHFASLIERELGGFVPPPGYESL